MRFFLKHHFDPDFDYQRLKPKTDDHGRVDHFNLGYVQNSIIGQVLAEWIPVPDDALPAGLDPKFVFDDKIFPAGHNCRPNPANPDQLVSTANGYVFYLDEKIHVKRVLNLRKGVNSRTGNVYFVSDAIVHGDVASGFECQAQDIRVQGNVEAASLQAGGSVLIEGGIKGAKKGMVNAVRSIRCSYAENAILKAGESIIVDGASMHCNLYAGRFITVRKRLVGGEVHSSHAVYVGEQLGGGMNTMTKVVLGYDAGLLARVEGLDTKIERLEARLDLCSRQAEKGAAHKEGCLDEGAKLERKLDILKRKRAGTWEDLEAGFNPRAKLLIPGEIRPGVFVQIGSSQMKVNDFLRDKRFVLQDGEVAMLSPALEK
ncbi:MAG: DUF342 domain-containing protein [Deltaproteobacteria bacterium]|nr:DUF342 domain-containing protein [Deltaproteobacteria bacterium]